MQEIYEQVSRNDSIICKEIIGIPDGFSPMHHNADALELRALATDFNYRIAWLQLNLSTFHSAIEQELCYAFLYKDLNFNIQPNALPQYRKTAYDALINIVPENDDYYLPMAELTQEDLFLCKHLPNAWTLADLYTYDLNDLPQASVDMYRLPIYYYACANKMANRVVIHPVQNRCLTVAEYAALFINTCTEFLQKQVDLFVNDFWKAQDWQSCYDGYEQKWFGSNVNGAFEKFFDMRQFKPHEPFPHQVPILQHKFNIDERGRLIHDWDTISRIYSERKRQV